MSGLRWGVIAASAALIISLALGIISGVRPLYIIIRALIFMAVFFGIGFGIRMVINSFFPELLLLEEEPVIHENNPQPGARVNITLGNTGEYAVPEMYSDSRNPAELGNIEDLISGAFKPRSKAESPPDQFRKAQAAGIDGTRENDYNVQVAGQDAFGSENFEFPSARPSVSAPPEKPVFTPSLGNETADLGGLPDLDSMVTAFSAGGEPGGAVSQAPSASLMEPIDEQLFEESALADSKPISRAGNKPQQLEGDFDPKDLAQGIRTVLSKEK